MNTISTQFAEGSNSIAPLHYRWLDGEWPMFDQAPQIPPYIWEQIHSDACGSAISSHIQYLSLGFFLINTGLLEPHPIQRKIDQNHVKQMRNEFDSKGIHRMDYPGVVIGLGKGWLSMNHRGPQNYLISPTSPHLHHLSKTHGGPIAQIIRGGHRTAAIRNYSQDPTNLNMAENFWYYRVLVPGQFDLKYFFFFVKVSNMPPSPSHQHSPPSSTSRLFMHRQCGEDIS
jgi:hypothetical protein